MTPSPAHIDIRKALAWLACLAFCLLFWGGVVRLACGQYLLALANDPQYPSRYDDWIAEAVLTADFHGDQWVDGTDYAEDGNAAFFYGQYEPWYGFRKLAEHLGGDAELEAQAVAAGDAWRDLYSVANGGGIPGSYNYTQGLALDWTLNGDTTSRDAVTTQAVTASYALTATPIQFTEYETYSRETAYAAMGYIMAEVKCGASYNDRLEALRDLMLGDVDDEVIHNTVTVNLEVGGHIEQWLGSYITDSNGDYVSGSHNFADGTLVDTYEEGYAPFMGAITAWTLIHDYDESANINGGVTPDTRTIAKLVRLADATWNEYWISGDQSMKYRWAFGDTGLPRTAGDVALNNIMFPWYSWLYLRTGDSRHRERAAALFNGTVDYESLTTRTGTPPAGNTVKEFNQLIRWTFDGLAWYSAGVTEHE